MAQGSLAALEVFLDRCASILRIDVLKYGSV